MNFSFSSQKSTILLSIIISTVFLVTFYGSVLTEPNEHLFTDWGDGMKNYYAYAYHISHDTSFVHFEGMNYPYGELHQFTDGQPFLANTVKIVDKVFPAADYYAVGILNFLVLLSFIISALFIALILSEFNIPPMVAGISSVVIIALSPQIHRLGGHLSLSYFFAFPMMWYFLIRFFKTSRTFFTVLVFVLNLILLYTHPYLSVMNSAFIIAYYVFSILIKPEKERPQFLLLHIIIQSILPVVIWLLFLIIYDSHPDRPQLDFMDKGLAVVHAVFLPNMGVLKSALNDIVQFRTRWESWSYIGTVSLVVFLTLAGRGIYNLIKKRKMRFFPSFVPQDMRVSFLASIIVLLYAFGVPYTTGFRFILDWIPELQQVRVVGRFAWVFFYVMNVFTIIVLYHVFLLGRWSKLIGSSLMFIVLLITFIEGFAYHNVYSNRYSENPNYFRMNADTKLNKRISESLKKIDTDTYQAIIPLPYYHVGNGMFQQEVVDHKGISESMVFSYHSGLPLTSVMMSRTSLPETKSLLKLTAPPYVKKPVLEKFSDKPFLVLVTDKNKIKAGERWLLKRSKKLVSNELFDVYSVQIKDLAGIGSIPGISRNPEYPAINADTSDRFFTKYFRNSKVNFPLDTANAERRNLNERVQILEKSAEDLDKNKLYEISFWYFNAGPDRIFSLLQVMQFSKNGNAQRAHNIDVRNELHFDEWTLVTLTFKIKKDIEKMRFFLKGQRQSNEKMYFTDVLFREYDFDLTGKVNDTVLFYNNYRITVNKKFWN